jgi:hypothetical protein
MGSRDKVDPFACGLDTKLVLRLLRGRSLQKKDLAEYYATDYFKGLTDFAIRHYGGCKLCGRYRNEKDWSVKRAGLLVHHVHYKTLFNEDVTRDITVLCKRCHLRQHPGKSRPRKRKQ